MIFSKENLRKYLQKEFDELKRQPDADNEEEYAQIIADQIAKAASKAAKKAKRAAEIAEKIALEENEHAAKEAAAKAKEIKAEAETLTYMKKIARDFLKSVIKRGSAVLKDVGKWRKETIEHQEFFSHKR